MARSVASSFASLGLALAAFGPGSADAFGSRRRGIEDIFDRPSVEIVGDRPQPRLKICPAGGRGGDRTWSILSFEGVHEVDAEGREVEARSISSLRDLHNFEVAQEEREVGGVPALVTRLSASLSFDRPCEGNIVVAGNAPVDEGRVVEGSGSITIESYVFLSNDTAVISYGNETIEVFQGQTKFNVQSTHWPFCADDHKLKLRMNVQVQGEQTRPKRFSRWGVSDNEELAERFARIQSGIDLLKSWWTEWQNHRSESEHSEEDDDIDDAEGDLLHYIHRLAHRKRFVVSAGDFDFDLDLPEVVLINGELVECTVELGSSTTRMDVDFTFPFFADSMLYDPVTGYVEEGEAGEVEDSPSVADASGQALDLASARSPSPLALLPVVCLCLGFTA